MSCSEALPPGHGKNISLPIVRIYAGDVYTECNRGSSSSIFPHHQQHMHPLLNIKTRLSQAHITSTSGKPPNSYQIIACIKLVERKSNTTNTLQQYTKKLEHPPLQSPHTRVCGKRWTYDITNNTPNMKTKPKTINTQTTNAIINSKRTRILTKTIISYTHPYLELNKNIGEVATTTKSISPPISSPNSYQMNTLIMIIVRNKSIIPHKTYTHLKTL